MVTWSYSSNQQRNIGYRWTLQTTWICFRYLVNSRNESKTSFTISLKHIFSRTCCRLCGRQRGNYLLSLYLFVKILYLLNALGQLFVLNALLETDYHLFGIHALQSLSLGKDWGLSRLFPRVTMCDLKVRRLGNVHRYTVQCVLPVNLFNEKIYLFLWFWIIVVIAVTFVSLLKWSLRAIIKIDRHRYIKKHLKLSGVKVRLRLFALHSVHRLLLLGFWVIG